MHRRRLILCGLVAVAAAVVCLHSWQREPAPDPPPVFPLPPARESPFANAQPGVEYVGASACATCHAENHAAWLETAHRLALADVDPQTEPPGGTFRDDAGRRQYEIDVRDGQVVHTEDFVNGHGDEVPVAEHGMRYVIGSGRFSRSYLIEVDGFLMESPATWYAARPGWGLSPGYEHYNPGFERPAEVRCVACHAGRVEPIDNSPHRLRILAQEIDCERCHGPGGLHVAAEQDAGAEPAAAGTIAHPGRLPRERGEAICAQCHFHGDASVTVRGRRTADFRPGMALEDFQAHYAFDAADRGMTVVGHFEQMRLSACYQHSGTFTCITCHDPHHRQEPAELQAFVREQCIACHAPESCGVPRARRVASQPDDHCARCHMPQVPTEIPHFAFTHHRVGIHPATDDEPDVASASSESPPRLVPLDDLSWMPDIDRQRCLGLAYVEVLDQAELARHSEHFHREAVRLLEDVHHQGLADPEVDAALARLHFGRDHAAVLHYAQAALAGESLSPDAESGALFALSATLCELNRATEALPYLERVVRLRRHAGAWHLLSVAREQQGDLPGALEAAIQAAESSPSSAAAAQHVADLYRRSGNEERAREFAERARSLAEFESAR